MRSRLASVQLGLEREMVEFNPFACLCNSPAEEARDRLLTENELCILWRAWEAPPLPSSRRSRDPT